MADVRVDSAQAVRETERKYEADNAAVLADPARLLGLPPGSGPDEVNLDATYFDTADLRLLRAGLTLRRRAGGHDEGWHLKLPAGPDSRDEIRLPLSGATRPPAELVALTRVHTRGAELAPVAELRTRRRSWVLADGSGRDLVELVDDQVDAHTMGEQTTAMSWREFEVELAEHGRPKLLDQVERRLLEVGARPATSGSKLGRVLADRMTAPTRRPKRVTRGSAAEVVLGYLRAQAEVMRGYDPRVRRDEPDALHQLRVAARRMRSVLQAYRDVLDRAATQPVIDDLRWLGTELSAARDSEVIEQRLTEVLGSLPEELVLGPVQAQVTRTMQRQRADGQRGALAALDSRRYLALHDAIDRLLVAPPLAKRGNRRARSELKRTVARSRRRTAKRMAAADRTGPGAARDQALHNTRKAAKRLRYVLEVAEPELGKKADRLRRRAKRLHKVLGEYQDSVVARPVIRQLAAPAQLDGGNGFSYGLLYAAEVDRARDALRELPAARRKLAKNRWPGKK
jgi:CHAD domain-containing protein